MSKEIPLRPHHLLCLSFFKGKGYSDQFVENMTKVLSTLKESDAIVKLTKGEDVICSACPNNNNGICTTQDKVDRYDSTTLSLCGLKIGETLPYNQLSKIAIEKIIDGGAREKVCGDCMWTDLCHKN